MCSCAVATRGAAQFRAPYCRTRTAPLWGLGQRIYFLHDGRADHLVQAIQAHASNGNRQYRSSEANAVIGNYNHLSTSDQQDLLNFLRSL